MIILMKPLIEKHVLKNAVDFGGRANAGAYHAFFYEVWGHAKP